MVQSLLRWTVVYDIFLNGDIEHFSFITFISEYKDLLKTLCRGCQQCVKKTHRVGNDGRKTPLSASRQLSILKGDNSVRFYLFGSMLGRHNVGI